MRGKNQKTIVRFNDLTTNTYGFGTYISRAPASPTYLPACSLAPTFTALAQYQKTLVYPRALRAINFEASGDDRVVRWLA